MKPRIPSVPLQGRSEFYKTAHSLGFTAEFQKVIKGSDKRKVYEKNELSMEIRLILIRKKPNRAERPEMQKTLMEKVQTPGKSADPRKKCRPQEKSINLSLEKREVTSTRKYRKTEPARGAVFKALRMVFLSRFEISSSGS